MLRLPYTLNNKPEYDKPDVVLEYFNGESITERPGYDAEFQGNIGTNALLEVDPHLHDWRTVLARVGKRIRPRHLQRLMEHDRVIGAADRSACIYLIVEALHRAGATPDEIGAVVWRSPYFIEKHRASVDRLQEEISRILGKLETIND